MKILYFDQQAITDMDMMWGFLELGYDVAQANTLVPDAEYTESDVAAILEELDNAELIITKDFSAAVAEACHRAGRVYLSWVHDSPQRSLYMKEAAYDTNIIFMFDRVQLTRLAHLNIPHLHHAPLAANVTRISALPISNADIIRFRADISFVGNLYLSRERDDYFKQLKPETLAEAEQILEQKTGFWSDAHTVYRPMSTDTQQDLESHLLQEDLDLYAFPDGYLVQTLILAREAACRERLNALRILSEYHSVHLYTASPDDARVLLPNVHIHGGIDPNEVAPKVFYSSKINLNLTIPSIESGVPQRVFDVMGAGGFMLSNYQSEAAEMFIPDREIVLFSDLTELKDKADYYLKNQKSRTKIAMNGYKRVSRDYNVPRSLQAMLAIVRETFGSRF